MQNSLWLTTNCLCHLTGHLRPLCPAQGTPSAGHPSEAGAPGTCRQLVPAPMGSIPAGTREQTKPREAGKKIPSLLCQIGRGGCRSHLASGHTEDSQGQAWQMPGTSQGPVVLLAHRAHLHSSTSIGGGGSRIHPISSPPSCFYPSCLCLPAQAPQHGVPRRAAPSIHPSSCSYFRERQEVFLVLPAPGRSSEPLSRSSTGARETAATLVDISCIIKLNPSQGLGLGHQLSEEGKEWSQRARG